MHGIYWDDWSLYNQDNTSIMSQFSMNKVYIAGYLHILLFTQEHTVVLYRVLTFVAFFISAILLMKVLRTIPIIDKTSSFYITLFYLILPVNSAKIALINVPSNLFLPIFFLAFYLLKRYIYKNHSLYLRIIVLALFFVSFIVNSLLVLYAIVLLYIGYTHYAHHGTLKLVDKLTVVLKELLKKFLDFILLPVLFFIYKNIYLVPTDLYADYNKINISLKGLLVTGFLMLKSLYTSLIEPLFVSLVTSLWHLPVFFLLALLSYALLSKQTVSKYKKRDALLLFMLGVFIFFLAVFPYAAVGKLPLLDEMASRHQLLVPLGFAFIVYFMIMYILNDRKKIAARTLYLVVSMFIMQNLYYGYRYQLDWFYQVGMEENFRNSELIRDNTTFIVENKVRDVLANARHIKFYEHNGRMKKVFGDDKRLMVKDIEAIKEYSKYKKYKQYNFSSWVYEKPKYLVIKKTEDVSIGMYCKLFYYQFFNEEKFNLLSKRLVLIEEKEV